MSPSSSYLLWEPSQCEKYSNYTHSFENAIRTLVADVVGERGRQPTSSTHTAAGSYSLVHLVVPKMEELISRSLLGLFKIRLLFQDRVRSQNLRLEWQCSTDHFLFKSSTPGRFPFKLQCRLKDLLVCFVWICYSSDKYLWSSRQEILQSQCQFQWKTAWCAGLKQKVISWALPF